MQLLNDLYNKFIKSFVKILLFVRFKLIANNLTSLDKSTNIKELSLNILIYPFEVFDLFDDKTSNLDNLHKEDTNKSKTINNCVRQVDTIERDDADRLKNLEVSSTITRTFI